MTQSNPKRPLSPHLQVYRLPMAALMSISHRASGMALTFGVFVLVAWLWAAAFSPECFAEFHKLFSTVIGKLALFGWSLAFFYHLCAGTRHLVWDAGFGYAKPTYAITNWIVLMVAVVLTLGFWVLFAGVPQ